MGEYVYVLCWYYTILLYKAIKWILVSGGVLEPVLSLYHVLVKDGIFGPGKEKKQKCFSLPRLPHLTQVPAYGLCHDDSALLFYQEISHRQYVNKYVWLCSNKTLLSKIHRGPHLSRGTLVCQLLFLVMLAEFTVTQTQSISNRVCVHCLGGWSLTPNTAALTGLHATGWHHSTCYVLETIQMLDCNRKCWVLPLGSVHSITLWIQEDFLEWVLS